MADRERILQKLQILDLENPLAALTIRWLCLGPRAFPPLRAPECFQKDLTQAQARELDWIVSNDELFELESLLRDSEVVTTDGDAQLLNTTWHDIPDLFKWLFKWVSADFTFKVGDFPGSGVPTLRLGGVTPDVRDLLQSIKRGAIRDEASAQPIGNLQNFLENHHLFAIPKVPLQRSDIKFIKKSFEHFLAELPHASSAKQSIALFGTNQQWRRFEQLYDQMHYDPSGQEPYHVNAVDPLITELIKAEVKSGKKSPNSKDMNRYRRDFDALEGAVFKTYPRFNLRGLIEDVGNKNRFQISDLQVSAAIDRGSAKLRTISPIHVLKRTLLG